MKPAVFFDRDGTLMRDVEYAARPEQVELLPGAADAVRELARDGFLILLITNQSGIGRGFFSSGSPHCTTKPSCERMMNRPSK